jgi:hypothetical protein
MSTVTAPISLESFVHELRTLPYWQPDGQPLPEWLLFAGTSWDAAWNAARDAAWNAAWNAATARDAAWNAAQDAALYAAVQIVCADLDIDPEWRAHVEARMQVWRKGYGLLCDVEGRLYVYVRAGGWRRDAVAPIRL